MDAKQVKLKHGACERSKRKCNASQFNASSLLKKQINVLIYVMKMCLLKKDKMGHVVKVK